MLEERDLKVDLLALGLLALVIFLAAALLSYDPADPPSKLVFPERAETLNICGRSGAMASRLLLDGLRPGGVLSAFSLWRHSTPCCWPGTRSASRCCGWPVGCYRWWA